MYPDCTIFDCQRPAEAARGWCWLHYGRWRYKGTPLWQPRPPKVRPPGLLSLTLAQRLFMRVEITDTCWLYTGSKTPLGYGHLCFQHKYRYAHRIAYELCVGPIPDGLTIDHRCCNPPCCNPDHLEAVTHRINVLRSPITQAAINARRTHCNHGHEFTPKNTGVAKRNGKVTGRRCRACNRINSLAYYYAKKSRQERHQAAK